MRHVKALSAIALVAIAAAAMATAASATSLCREKAEVCPAASVYPAGTAVKARLKKGTEAVLKTSVGTIKCRGSRAGGKTTKASGEPLPGLQEEMTFEECVFGTGTACTIKVEHLPWLIQGTEIEPGNGFVTVSSDGSGIPQTHVECGSFINCTWGDEKITLDGEGGAPAIERLLEVELVRISGFICPTSAKATAEYEVTEPSPVFVSAKP
jgi:hypothetical protein